MKHTCYGESWWEIEYSDCYITQYIEIGEDEIDIESIEELFKYADNWLLELLENINLKYNKIYLDFKNYL